jgi:hypothetical protein
VIAAFSVLNPAYPESQRTVDTAALDLRPFAAGVVVGRQSNSAVWVHPLGEPVRAPKMLASGVIRPADLHALCEGRIRPGYNRSR